MTDHRKKNTLVRFAILLVVIALVPFLFLPDMLHEPSLDEREPSLEEQPASFDERIGCPNVDYDIVRTFFATDRNLTGKTEPDRMFGALLANLSYGIADVSIPCDHRLGDLESPYSFWIFEFPEDPADHVVLLKVIVDKKDIFFANLASHVRRSELNSALLFVHGFSVTFEDATRRTAQIAYDLEFEGAPVFYSWPSQGKETAYKDDEKSIKQAQANFRGFLEDFLARSDAQNIYLIAHSMGNRALLRAIVSLLTEKPALRSRITEVILAAPDINAEVFKRDIVPAITGTGRPITLYVSSEDRALMLSKTRNGYPRAGDSGQEIIVVPGIETIDATGVSTSFWKHSYYAENRSVLADMYYLIRHHQRADQRFGLRSMVTEAGLYWEFKQ